jgi:hypothetical protein
MANILKQWEIPHLILQVYVNFPVVDLVKYMTSFASVEIKTNIHPVILATLHIPGIYVSNIGCKHKMYSELALSV